MKKLLTPLATLTLAAAMCCCNPAAPDTAWLQKGIDRAAVQAKATAQATLATDSLLPRSLKDGQTRLIDAEDWTSGFFPGSLWMLWELTGDEALKEYAKNYTARLHKIPYYEGTHDLGFMILCSYGQQNRLMGDQESTAVINQTSETLIKRFDEQIGLIRSWDFGDWNYPVIIDNMMNLEMLFWSARHTGDARYREIAIRHADRTIENHYRPDYSSYHVVSYNNDGTVESRGTYQGYADPSSWARGQAWGLYGYTMCMRETKLDRYLDQARGIAQYIMNNPTTPADCIPYWDYSAPGMPDAPRDASAAAITASALLELSTLTTGDESKSYFEYAEKILRSLSSPAYLAEEGTNGGFAIMHCTGHLPGGSEIDVPLNYADYYYIEAAKRYLELVKAA